MAGDPETTDERQEPRVAVVIPVFNGAAAVEAAIASALEAGPDVEVIVVDDGSTDETPAVLEAIDDPRVRRLAIAHGGVSKARNEGARLARAPVVVFLDADDQLLPGWLPEVIKAHSSQQAQVACWPVLWQEAGAARTGAAPNVARWEVGGFIAGAFSITASLFEELGGYDPLLGYAESTELSMRLRDWLRRHEGGLVILDDPWCARAVHRSRHERRLAYAERRLFASEHIVNRHATTLLAGSYLLRRYLAVGGTSAARLGRWPDAKRLFARSIRGHPSIRGVGRLAVASTPGLRDLVWRGGLRLSRNQHDR